MDAISPLPATDRHKPLNMLGAGLRHLAALPDSPVGKKLASAAAAGFSHALEHLAHAEGAGKSPSRGPDAAFGAGSPRGALQIVGVALDRAVQLHDLFASAPPALPGPPAARAPENLPGAEQIKAAYGLVSRLH